MIRIDFNIDGAHYPLGDKAYDNKPLQFVQAFPQFVMRWFRLQLAEIQQSITRLPDFSIMLPDFSGML